MVVVAYSMLFHLTNSKVLDVAEFFVSPEQLQDAGYFALAVFILVYVVNLFFMAKFSIHRVKLYAKRRTNLKLRLKAKAKDLAKK